MRSNAYVLANVTDVLGVRVSFTKILLIEGDVIPRLHESPLNYTLLI